MSGQFTVGSPDPSTGKGHMVLVKCDLCPADPTLFDPRKVENAQNEIDRLIREHMCKKVSKEKKKRRFIRFIRPAFEEYEIGTRRHRLGRPEEGEE